MIHDKQFFILKITDKSLDNIIKNEFKKLIIDYSIDTVKI